MDNSSKVITRVTDGATSQNQLPEVDLSGKTLADFRILRRLGTGGMGQVYLAEQSSLKRPIALKILKADLAVNPTSLKRFKAEGEAVARATHANIVQVYAIGDVGGLHYMAMEYVEGLNLREYITKKGSPPLPFALSIMRQVAAALQRAGELGIVHRDIKPENILLTRKGVVKVADFGLSRCFADEQHTSALTQPGVTMGTPLYMSPEQVEGKDLDPRSDIYSFGVTCYHMLAGDPPFRGQTAFEIALRHVQSEPEELSKTRPDLPSDLCAIIHKMMAKQPAARYQTGRELLKELTRLRDALSLTLRGGATPVPKGAPVLEGEGVKKPIAELATSGSWSKRKLVGIAALSAVGALMGSTLLGWNKSRPVAHTREQDNTSAEVADAEAASPQKQHEQFLLAAVQEYERPRDQNQIGLGIGHCLELGMFYLEQWRLDDADRLFGRLIENPAKVRAYAIIGRLGHAVVLAFRDEAVKSNDAFLAVVTGKEQGTVGVRGLLNRNPRFLQMIGRALAQNAANYEAANRPFPVALEELRKAQPLPNGPGRRGRAAEKPGEKVQDRSSKAETATASFSAAPRTPS